jgi:hypothetical protein
MQILVGNTGFVGSNIANQFNLDLLFNSSNIKESYGLNPDLLIYSGVKAEKYFANLNPEKDFEHIKESIENIKQINPNKIILISTVDVYDNYFSRDENYSSPMYNLQPYGKNRLYLENWVENNIKNYHIIRLSALFGKNLKKNFIFDILNPIPSKLSLKIYQDLLKKNNVFSKIYEPLDSNFYQLIANHNYSKEEIKEFLNKANFNSLYFTDSDATFQFYNLANIGNDLNLILNNNLNKVNLVTEPIKASEIYKYLFDSEFVNKISKEPVYYNLKTVSYNIFGGFNGYIKSKEIILEEIRDFINKEK